MRPCSWKTGLLFAFLMSLLVELAFARSSGDEEDRTPDPLRARQVLSQLSYTPVLWGPGTVSLRSLFL